jgi:hypothetical protein
VCLGYAGEGAVFLFVIRREQGPHCVDAEGGAEGDVDEADRGEDWRVRRPMPVSTAATPDATSMPPMKGSNRDTKTGTSGGKKRLPNMAMRNIPGKTWSTPWAIQKMPRSRTWPAMPRFGGMKATKDLPQDGQVWAPGESLAPQ